MNKSKILLVIKREFLVRVKKRSFIIMTILTPLLFAALIILPSIIMTLSSGEKDQTILVVDHSGICEPHFKHSKSLSFVFDPTADVEAIKKEFPKEYSAVVEISAPDSMFNMSLAATSPKQLNIETKSLIERYVKRAAQKVKMESYNIENLDKIVEELDIKISMKTYTITEEGDQKVAMVELFMGISYFASFMIYMFIFMFGSMVMRGVIEEKSSRIVEVIVSSVRPFELMLGKILGVGAVAMTQFFIWIVLTVGITVGVNSFVGFDKLAGNPSQVANMLPQEGTMDVATMVLSESGEGNFLSDIIDAFATVPVFSIIFSFLLYFTLGYLLYAALFAAVGSAVDNEADTQQLILPVTLPLILGLFIMIHTFQHPDSTLSFWGSMIPFTSPMVMMARVPFGVPLWELLLSLSLLFVTFLLITILSAKIYRVGILMYGKRPTLKELYKWLKY